jgi:hypothetical protein
MGFSVLPPFISYGVQGHGYSYENKSGLQDRLKRNLSCQRRLPGQGSRGAAGVLRFPWPEHGKHIRTSNPIESTFATVRHRTTRAKGCLSHDTGMIMVFKLIQAAQASWRRLDGQNQLPKLIEGVKFIDGLEAGRDYAAA